MLIRVCNHDQDVAEQLDSDCVASFLPLTDVAPQQSRLVVALIQFIVDQQKSGSLMICKAYATQQVGELMFRLGLLVNQWIKKDSGPRVAIAVGNGVQLLQ